jgi:hypothetical protein
MRLPWGTVTDSSNIQEYIFNETLTAGDWVTITLTWDRHVESTNIGSGYLAGDMFFPGQMNDLDLYLLTATNQTIATSISTDDNVEHIFVQVPEDGEYKIGVLKYFGGYSASQNFALSWWAGEAPHIPGDFDEDGDVDGEDLDEWESGFGVSGAGDSGFDDDSDGADFLAWQQNLGAGIPARAASGAVPEPAMSLLCCLGLPLLSWGRRV